MSSEIINTDIKKIKTVLKESSLKKDLSDEEAFEYLVLQYFWAKQLILKQNYLILV